MKETSTENATNPTTQVKMNSLLIGEGNKLSQATKARKLFIKSVFLYRKSLSKLRFWLIEWSPTFIFSSIYKPYYLLASASTHITAKVMGATLIKTRGSFAKKDDPNFIPVISDIDINLYFDHINRRSLFAFDFLAACFPFLSIHIHHNPSHAVITSLYHHSKMGDIFLKDWKAWRILTKTFPQYVSQKIPTQRVFIHTSLLSDAGMTETNLLKIVNSRQNFHQIRKLAVSSTSILEDWAHILRSIPTNSKLDEVEFWNGKFEGLREIDFSDKEIQQFSEIFPLGISAICIDYHPWRYQDRHTIWITSDDVTAETIKQLANSTSTFRFFSFNNYVSYPMPMILCEKHLANSYLPKLAYLPRYKIRSDLTVELTPPKIWIRSLAAEVIYETLLLMTDIWKMSRDRFARGRMNDLVDGQIPGLILLLSHKVFVGNISDIQKKFKELYPNHPLWDLQAEIRRTRPDIIKVQNLFPPLLEELRKALVQNDI